MGRRAPRFEGFVGHRQAVGRLSRLLDGARLRKEPFPHTLITGPAGVGKTKFIQSLATAYGTKCVQVMGFQKEQELGSALLTLRHHDFLFIEEAHRLGLNEQEFLCQAIDNEKIPHTIADPDNGDKPVVRLMPLVPWTLLLATDQPGQFLQSLQTRIVNNVHLNHYEPHELKEIVAELARTLGMLLTPQAALALAEVSHGLPRNAKQLLVLLRLASAATPTRQLGLEDVRAFLAAEGIDSRGLKPIEQRYLGHLAQRKRLSLGSMAQLLGCDIEYVQSQVESPLIRTGLVEIAPTGRRLTKEGLQWVASPSGRETREKGEGISSC
ncbi:MAG: hypothetical protein K2R98_15830 [Gemmataceae bacterium]|nr:hypothetical protein [Gemmataceae bacterium]